MARLRPSSPPVVVLAVLPPHLADPCIEDFLVPGGTPDPTWVRHRYRAEVRGLPDDVAPYVVTAWVRWCAEVDAWRDAQDPAEVRMEDAYITASGRLPRWRAEVKADPRPPWR